jgi:hypothetical protein
LSYVSSTATFDQQLTTWVATDYAKLKYAASETFNWNILTFQVPNASWLQWNKHVQHQRPLRPIYDHSNM